MRWVLCAVLAACALDNTLAPDAGGLLDFQIGDIDFAVSSGGAVIVGGTLTLYLTDNPDACSAILLAPAGRLTIFGVKVTGGGGTQTIGAGVAKLSVEAGGKVVEDKDAVDGVVSWSVNSDGTYNLASLDAGFDGTTTRLQVAGVTLQACGTIN